MRRLAFSPQRWRAGEAVPMLGLHYNCCAFRLGATRATLDEATRCMVIMLDDLGDMPGKSKASLDRVLALPSAVQPHAVIATRRDGRAASTARRAGSSCRCQPMPRARWCAPPHAPAGAIPMPAAACAGRVRRARSRSTATDLPPR